MDILGIAETTRCGFLTIPAVDPLLIQRFPSQTRVAQGFVRAYARETWSNREQPSSSTHLSPQTENDFLTHPNATKHRLVIRNATEENELTLLYMDWNGLETACRWTGDECTPQNNSKKIC